MTDLTPTAASCITRIREILEAARAQALRTVNAAMVAAYWEIGREIVEEEQRGAQRAAYGTALIDHLAARLTTEFGKGFSARNLRLVRQFYLAYADRPPHLRIRQQADRAPTTSDPGTPDLVQGMYQIGQDVDYVPVQAGASPADLVQGVYQIAQAAAGAVQQGVSQSVPLLGALSWSHYRVLMRVTRLEARSFYEVECIRSKWSVAELERQIGSLLFERLASSRDQEGVLALAREGHRVYRAADLIKDPYVLEFTGLPEAARWYEDDLEQALIDRLQHFLLELGNDLFLAARQKRITIDGDHYHIDLVFYHRSLRCFLLVDLKTGRLTQQDIGQMLLYTGYYETEEVREGENPPIGLILCTDKNDAAVRYTLSKNASQVFASRYQLHLPSEADLRAELQRERDQILAQRTGRPEGDEGE